MIGQEYNDLSDPVLSASGSTMSSYEASNGIQLKIVGKCSEDVRFQSERDLRRAIKVLFDEHKIDIALPKVFIEDVKK